MGINSYSYQPRRRKRFSLLHPRTVGTGFLFLALGIMLFHAYQEEDHSSSFLSRFVLAPVSVVQTIRSATIASASHFMDFFNHGVQLGELQKENEQLLEEINVLRYKLQLHQALHEALKFPQEEEFPGTVAIVKMRDNRMTQSLIINRGAADGISKNRPVLTSTGLVGRTYRLSENFSRVQLLTDPGSAIGVYIEGTSYEGILRGMESGEQLLLTDLHHYGGGDESLTPQPGQKILTSGTALVFPRDLLAGTISDVTSEKGFRVEPAVDFRTVQSVIVLTSSTLREEMLSLLTEN